MKRIVVLIFIIPILAACVSGGGQKDSGINPAQQQVPFSKGVTFSKWFGETVISAQTIQFNKYVEQDFANVKKLGTDVIRLPISFNVLTSSAPDYKIDPLFFKFLDTAVDWAEKYQIYIILDNHPDWHDFKLSKDYRSFLIPVWTQIAEHYKNRSEYVIYEILNEPSENDIPASSWGKMQGDVVDTIREIDKNHWIVVSGLHTEQNPAIGLSYLPKYSDNKLLYTFHFYDPHVFTFQGDREWPDASFGGIPFPYERSRMPKIPNKIKGTWIEDDLKNYPRTGTTAALTRKIDQIANFAKKRNVPVFCGEFGVMMWTCLPEDRIRYNQFFNEASEARNMPWILWDSHGQCGIFNSPQQYGGDINTDLNVELVRALGLNPPPQVQRHREPLKSSFTIYDDSLRRESALIFSQQSTLNMYYTPAAEGEYAIHWGNINRKGDSITIEFTISDFTSFVQNGFAIEFKAKTGKQILFDVKLLNFQDNFSWHIGYTITQRQLSPDGEWHTIRIPLRDMRLRGGVDNATNQWVETKSKAISWANTYALEVTMLNEDGYVCEIYLDHIKITE